MAIVDDSKIGCLRLEVVGKKPKDRPYLRIAYFDGQYIASISKENVLRGLANQILRALDNEQNDK